MKLFASATFLLPLFLVACATAVTQDLSEGEVTEGGSAGSTSTTGGSPTVNEGGKSSGTAGKAGSPTTNAFGGSASTAGTGSGGKPNGGAAGSSAGTASTAGSGGKSSTAGAGGTSSGGKAGSGSGGASAGAAGTATGTAGSVGTGSCTGTAKFMIDDPPVPTKYALGAKVVATCNGGTPCTLAKPAGQNGKTYEFSCTDQYNCGGQDPATTNWAQPPWQMTKACE